MESLFLSGHMLSQFHKKSTGFACLSASRMYFLCGLEGTDHSHTQLLESNRWRVGSER